MLPVTVCVGLLALLHGASPQAFDGEVYVMTTEKLDRLKVFLDNQTEHSDLLIPPYKEDGSAVDVSLGMHVISLTDIRQLEMDFSFSMYLRHQWNDPRLAYPDSVSTDPFITVPESFFKNKLWMPDTYFANSKSEKFHEIIRSNWMMRLYKHGRVWFSQRYSLTVWCFLYLHRFPMDEQTCRLAMALYRYNSYKVTLRWMNEERDDGSPVGHELIELAESVLVNEDNLTTGDCTDEFSASIANNEFQQVLNAGLLEPGGHPGERGRYSCVFVDFVYQRQFGYYLIQIYVPSSLVVILSWVSFYLDPLAIPGRVSLGLLTILTMSQQMASAVTGSMPKISYETAIDVWLSTCMVFVFGALLEFAVSNHIARIEVSKDLRPVPEEVSSSTAIRDYVFERDEDMSGCRRFTSRVTASGIDKVAQWSFPIVFVCFNIFYWVMYKTEALYYIVDKHEASGENVFTW